MYPIFRMAKEIFFAKSQPDLGLDGTYETHHICWPWDLDAFMELNNGRTLTLMDLGRLPMAFRSGLYAMLKREKWTMTMAGVVVRYRRRVTMFQRLKLTGRVLGRDERFLYLEQTFWRKGEAVSSAVYRVAITPGKGLVHTDEVAMAMGHPEWNPDLPDWVKAWVKAEEDRPWPPIV